VERQFVIILVRYVIKKNHFLAQQFLKYVKNVQIKINYVNDVQNQFKMKNKQKEERISGELFLAIREADLSFEDKLFFPWTFPKTWNEIIKDLKK
jgi:hypothetical protein